MYPSIIFPADFTQFFSLEPCFDSPADFESPQRTSPATNYDSKLTGVEASVEQADEAWRTKGIVLDLKLQSKSSHHP